MYISGTPTIVVGGIEVHTGLLVSGTCKSYENIKILTLLQVGKRKSIWSWPSGHATDSEDTIAFAALHGINYLVEEFPLEQYNEAFGNFFSLVPGFILCDLLTFYSGYDGGKCTVSCGHHNAAGSLEDLAFSESLDRTGNDKNGRYGSITVGVMWT
jgi:hypothetical protein